MPTLNSDPVMPATRPITSTGVVSCLSVQISTTKIVVENASTHRIAVSTIGLSVKIGAA